ISAMAPGGQHGRRQDLEVELALERKEAGEPLAVPYQHATEAASFTLSSQRRQEYPVLVERIRLAGVCSEVLPSRDDGLQSLPAAHDLSDELHGLPVVLPPGRAMPLSALLRQKN